MQPAVKNKSKARLGAKVVFHEYCTGSSIHGVRYFDSAERTACERFWWIIVFLLSMVGCGTMIYKTYVKWNQAPIIVSFSEKTTPVWEMQFPAVTICPETKVSTARLNFTKEITALHSNWGDLNGTINTNTIGQLKAVAQVCTEMFQTSNFQLSELNGTNENDVVHILKNVSLNRHRVVGVCSFGDAQRSCYRYLKETVTENGLCYSFNMLPEDQIFRKGALHHNHTYLEDWDEDEDDDEDGEASAYPLHATDAGLQAGLKLYLITEKANIDYMCTGLAQGYKLMLHEAGEYPQVSKRNIRIPLGHEMSIAVKPQMITTSQSAADYHWSKRQCFFDNERHLRFFRIYNQENCELECLTNITLAVCGCVRFSMPRAPGTDVCSLNMWFCMHQARSFFRQYRNSSDIVSSQYRVADGGSIVSECNCLPACSSIQYDVEVTQSAMDLKKFLEANRIIENKPDRYAISILDIYFKESHFITSRRSELYGMVDFLANCGGLLGLFMGVSILSLLEICYYMTIRPFSLRTKERRKSNRETRRDHVEDNTLLAVITKVD